jgi:hypothetical protein
MISVLLTVLIWAAVLYVVGFLVCYAVTLYLTEPATRSRVIWENVPYSLFWWYWLWLRLNNK